MPPRPKDASPTVKFGAHDPDRKCTVAWIKGLRRPGGEGWLIHVDGEFLPFELTRCNVGDDGQDRRDIIFSNFGSSPAVSLFTGVLGKTLGDSSEVRELQILSIEGVLVAHKGIETRYWSPPIFTALGREWRLGDFGYVEECGSEAM